jgi:H+/gluconate symporter-like permease
MDSVLISSIAILACIVLFIYLTMKGTGLIITCFICVAILSFFAIGGFKVNFFTTFPNAAGGMFGGVLLPMGTGSLMGGLLNATGMTDRISTVCVKKFGVNSAYLIIIFLTAGLVFVGAQVSFIIAYLGIGLMKKANLPRYIGMVAMAGSMPIGMLMIPGSSGMGNLCPTWFLPTTIYAAPVMGMILSVFAMAGVMFYCRYLIKDAKKKGLGYDPMTRERDEALDKDEADMPSLAVSIIPLLVMLATCLIGILVLKVDSTNAVIAGQIFTSIVTLLLGFKYIKGSKYNMVDNTVRPALVIIVGMPCIFGFTAIVQNTTAYAVLVEKVLSWSINPYLFIVIAVSIIAAICADGFSGMIAFLTLLGDKMMALGANPEAIHRLCSITATGFDSVPHNSNVFLNLELWGYTHKQGYKYLVVCQIVIPIATALLGVILANIMYPI